MNSPRSTSTDNNPCLQDQSHATAQGFHTLQHSQQPRSMIQQQHSHSPRQPSHPPVTTSSQGPGSYIASHSSTTSLPTQQYQSPYIGSVPTISHHHPGETTFFGAHPSPYSSHSAAGSYASSGVYSFLCWAMVDPSTSPTACYSKPTIA